MVFNDFNPDIGPLVTQKSVSEDVFYEFCRKNPELRTEYDKHGKLIIMPPIKGFGSAKEGIAYGELYVWWRTSKLQVNGKTFSPSGGFTLPDGSIRSPDGAWASEERLSKLTPSDEDKFMPLVPDFILEVRSPTDSLPKLKKKMEETWIKNGVRLAWLIDPLKQKAYIYREDGTTDTIEDFEQSLDGEKVCSKFQLDLSLFK